MMINKRLIGTVEESKKYIAGNVLCQWISLAANITMMTAVARLLQGLYEGNVESWQIGMTAGITVIAVPHCVFLLLCKDHSGKGGGIMKKALNIALLISFVATVMVPLTGIHIHKLASVLFLLLCIIHTIVYRSQLGAKRWLLLVLIAISFLTGLFGMIWEQIPMVMILHRAISIGVVFFLAIHIFVFRKRISKKL